MTSEKKLRDIALKELNESRLEFKTSRDEYSGLFDFDWVRVLDLMAAWPILPLPIADRDGCLWPTHGRNYGHVKRSGDTVTIARGGVGACNRSMTLNRAEAMELASLLVSIAWEGS